MGDGSPDPERLRDGEVLRKFGGQRLRRGLGGQEGADCQRSQEKCAVFYKFEKLHNCNLLIL